MNHNCLVLRKSGGGDIVPPTANCTPVTGAPTDADCVQDQAVDAAVTLTANAAAGSLFAGWTNCDNALNGTCNETMDAATGDKTISARFDDPIAELKDDIQSLVPGVLNQRQANGLIRPLINALASSLSE